MNDAPTFSVVITTYNYGHLINRAIKSVLGQSCKCQEIIVVDDGSTDDTESVMSKYSDCVRYMYKENGGQSSALNLGISVAQGDFIYILDADDELLPDALEMFSQAVREAQEQGQAERIFYGGYISVDPEGKQRIRRSTAAPEEPIKRLREFIGKKLTGLKHGGFIIPRKAFETLRYPEDIRHNTDLVFVGQALTYYPATAIDSIVLKSHEHPMRVRKRRGSNISHGTRTVDSLFNPEIIDKKFFVIKQDFLAARLRSLGRMHYLGGDYIQAKKAYREAFSAKAGAVLELSTLKRWLVSELRSLVSRAESE